MAEIGSWNGHIFTVSPALIRGFTELTIKGSSETTNKTSSSQQYVTRKSGNPSEITLTVGLSAFTGCDVKNEALKFVDEAHSGAKNYFYLGGKKLLPCQLMLVEASVTETEIAAGGTWAKCKVRLTMKQCSKYDGTSSSSGSSTKKSSSSSKKTTKKTSTKTTSVVSKVASTVKNAAKAAVSAVKKVASKVSTVSSAVKKINQVVKNAKKASTTTKKTTATVKKKVTTTTKKIQRLTK